MTVTGQTLAPSGPVVLATEFGPVSEAAERSAIELARQAGRSLIVVHAIDPRRPRWPLDGDLRRVDQIRAAREPAAAALVDRASRAGVSARVLIWTGDPATCVVDAARAEGAACIVIGSHGRGRLGRAIQGSVSAAVVQLAPCPVDVVRFDADGLGLESVGPEPDGPRERAIRP